MTAGRAGAGRLMALYAFNLEVARAGFVTSEPMLGESGCAGGRTRSRGLRRALRRGHEVCEPLAEAIRGTDLPRAPFDAMIAARRWDCHREPFADVAALEEYLEATGAGLMWLAALPLGAPGGAEPAVRDAGRGGGGGGFPARGAALAALGLGRAAGRRWRAGGGRARLAGAGAGGAGGGPGGALPALLPAAAAGATLRGPRAASGARARAGASEFRARAAMLGRGSPGAGEWHACPASYHIDCA